MKKLNTIQAVICITIVAVSLVTTIVILCDLNRPYAYMWLFLMPLIFSLLSIVFYHLYSFIPSNIAITALLALMFVRNVLSPLFMVFGNYAVTINTNLDKNTFYAICLVCYETIAVFFVLFFLGTKTKKNDLLDGKKLNKYPVLKQQKIYRNLLLVLLGVLLVCLVITPEIMLTYRSILDMTNPDFANYEDAYVVAKYGTTFITKLSLVMGQYLMRIIPVFFPAYAMVILAKKGKSTVCKLLSLLLCLVPFLFVGGAIARSLIYALCLFFLYTYLYPSKKNTLRIMILFGIMGLIIILWWLMRTMVTGGTGIVEFIKSLSSRLSAYFSGVNIVSGAFNLPQDPEYILRYFAYDFLGSVPFGTTLFGLDEVRISTFFNTYNQSSGQIPTTIGMGYYYFGGFLAPIYSVVFAIIAVNSAKKLNKEINPFIRIRLLLTTFYFSMGIIMYNIEIVITNFFTILLPMYIIECIAYTKDKKNDT